MEPRCATCNNPLSPSEAGGERCHNCWEVEKRLGQYLRGGQTALDFVQAAMDERSRNLRLVQTVQHAEHRDEVERAAALWLQLATLWDSAEEDELHDKLADLMAQWKAGTAVEGAGEMAQAAGLWERFVTLWESYQSAHGEVPELVDSLLDKLATLVDEWQGFAGEKEEG